MKKIVFILIVLIIGLFFGCTQEANTQNNNLTSTDLNKNVDIKNPTGTNSVEVTIQGFAYKPAELIITPGTTVTWTNLDSVAHTVTSDNGSELNSELFGKDGKYSHTFNSIGTFDYHCAPHPSMKGKVVVQ
jgi:amicyanin